MTYPQKRAARNDKDETMSLPWNWTSRDEHERAPDTTSPRAIARSSDSNTPPSLPETHSYTNYYISDASSDVTCHSNTSDIVADILAARAYCNARFYEALMAKLNSRIPPPTPQLPPHHPQLEVSRPPAVYQHTAKDAYAYWNPDPPVDYSDGYYLAYQNAPNRACQYWNNAAGSNPQARALAANLNFHFRSLRSRRDREGYINKYPPLRQEIQYPLWRLVVMGLDTERNIALLLGPEWRASAEQMWRDFRLEALGCPQRRAMPALEKQHLNRDLPRWEPRPANKEEEAWRVRKEAAQRAASNPAFWFNQPREPWDGRRY